MSTSTLIKAGIVLALALATSDVLSALAIDWLVLHGAWPMPEWADVDAPQIQWVE